MKKLIIVQSIVSVVVIVCATLLALFAAGHSTLSQELRVRELFAKQAFHADALNQVLSEQNINVHISGDIDGIGNPEDDWVAFSHEYLGIGEGDGVFDVAIATAVLLMMMNLAFMAMAVLRSEKAK